MQIHHLAIDNFRGIRELRWNIFHPFVLLVGPGDSGKSTILDAIELALSARRQITFNDGDFYLCDITKPLCIQVTIGGYPREWGAYDRLGLYQRGWSATDGLHDEPQGDDERVLTVQLKVEKDLDGDWSVVNDRCPEPKRLRAIERDHIAAMRLGTYVDHHLSWSRSSLLSRITGDVDGLANVLATAQRTVREQVAAADLGELRVVAQRAQLLAARLGVSTLSDLKPAVDPQAFTLGSGLLALHEGSVPSRMRGTGSRRLLALALEKASLDTGAIAVVDEIEHGLEPHRLRHVLAELRRGLTHATGQLFLTTHAPAAVVECEATDLHLVRQRDGRVEVLAVPMTLQGVVRKAPEALLARAAIVCEGKTEVGFLRALDSWWAEQGMMPLSHRGVVLVDGAGNTQGPPVAIQLCRLGFRVAFFGDSDEDPEPSESEQRAAGVEVVLWRNRLSIEQVLAHTLPWSGVLDMLQRAGQPLNVRSAVLGQVSGLDLNSDIRSWQDSPQARKAIGLAAKMRGRVWFKSVDGGEELGMVAAAHLPDMDDASDLKHTLAKLRTWIDVS